MNQQTTMPLRAARRTGKAAARRSHWQWLLALLLTALLCTTAHYAVPYLYKTPVYRVLRAYVLDQTAGNKELRAKVRAARRAYRQAAGLAPHEPIRLPQKESLRPLPSPAAGSRQQPAARQGADPNRYSGMDLLAMEKHAREKKRQLDDFAARTAANTHLRMTEALWGRAHARARAHAVFWLRLAITLPVALLALWWICTARRGVRAPLVWGFAGFALFMVCVELLPYALDSRKTGIVREGIIQL